MKRLRLCAFAVWAALMLAGYLSAPELIPPRQVPAYVRDIKYIRLYGQEQNPVMKGTVEGSLVLGFSR